MLLLIIALLASCSDESRSDSEIDVGAAGQKRDYVFAYKQDSDEARLETRAGVLTSRRWVNGQTIRVKFLNGSAAAQAKVKEVANTWLNYANLNFEYVNVSEDADVKVAFQWENDHITWSKIGTDSKAVSQTKPSMNLMLYNQNDIDEINSEDFSASILREFGHVLGLIYEHQGPDANINWDENRVVSYFKAQGWSLNQIDMVFDSYNKKQTNYTEFDGESIMLLYFPDFLTTDGKGTKWNTKLSETDKQFISTVYPGKAPVVPVLPTTVALQYTQDGGATKFPYTGVRIGEYYWVNNNFYHEVPRNGNNLEGWENDYPITQARLDKYLPCARLDVSQYQINIADFKKYYGIYYNRQSVNYMTTKGKVYEGEDRKLTNWGLPAAADYQQLFAMCPFSTDKSTALSERDVRFALAPKAGSNPLAFNINDPNNGPYKTYWFLTGDNINIYNFNMMPGGAKLNGSGTWTNGVDDPHYGDAGDIYHLFYTVGFHTKESNIYIHDFLDTKNPFSYHWYNVRWCRPLTDVELGYKLYINTAKTDIKKLGVYDAVPAGYAELPKGYLRGFYVQYILDNPNPKYTVANIVEFANKVEDRTL